MKQVYYQTFEALTTTYLKLTAHRKQQQQQQVVSRMAIPQLFYSHAATAHDYSQSKLTVLRKTQSAKSNNKF